MRRHMKNKNKKVKNSTEPESVDRISKLPDELIHQILSFVDTRLVVKTSVLSKRWKLIWTTLPFLKIDWYDQHIRRTNNFSKFLDHVFTRRNRNSNLSKLELHVQRDVNHGSFPVSVRMSVESLISVEKYVKYAILHNVEDLNVSCHFAEFSVFNSENLKNLKLAMDFDNSKISELECWDLPALTTLHLKSHSNKGISEVPESCLICLPALSTLCLEDINIPESSRIFSLPALTSLLLINCQLPNGPCDFPALLSLELADVLFPEGMTEFLSALVSLQSLTLYIRDREMQNCVIYCPQLVNLKIGACISTVDYDTDEIEVIAPKLRNYWSRGIFPITFEGGLQDVNVYVQLWETIEYKHYSSPEKLLEYFLRLMLMFPGLSGARTLTLDLDTIEALSEISNFVVDLPSPFHNLKYVKLPRGYTESSISCTVRNYLLGGSPRATFVTTLPQNNVIPQTAQNVPLEEPLATTSKELVKSQDIRKTVLIDSVEMSVQEEHVVGNPGVDADTVRQISSPVQGLRGQIPDAHIAAGADSHKPSFSRGNSHFRLWQGHEVNPEFVGLLDLIMKKYPETFEHFTTKSKKFCTMELNTLCTSVNAFTQTSLTEVDTEMVTEYRALFADLQRSFNIKWLVSRLDYIEQLRFSNILLYRVHAIDSLIDDAKSKLQDLQTLRAETMTKIQKAFGTKDNNIAVGCIGGDLLYGP